MLERIMYRKVWATWGLHYRRTHPPYNVFFLIKLRRFSKMQQVVQRVLTDWLVDWQKKKRKIPFSKSKVILKIVMTSASSNNPHIYFGYNQFFVVWIQLLNWPLSSSLEPFNLMKSLSVLKKCVMDKQKRKLKLLFMQIGYSYLPLHHWLHRTYLLSMRQGYFLLKSFTDKFHHFLL